MKKRGLYCSIKKQQALSLFLLVATLLLFISHSSHAEPFEQSQVPHHCYVCKQILDDKHVNLNVAPVAALIQYDNFVTLSQSVDVGVDYLYAPVRAPPHSL
ncbi:hypothetical protein [Thalassotalea agarivorans]|uniref:DUF2946 domain-containing protein n=1 Tax=Thalassotalea agarivorans TaxID=349064 RepID=A0A1I0ATN7_THASX|nr:hypothetical protein [Thalassotalea agarivorans]SES97765.1 hypothetical protein SAMN05660429_00814 [Thalassotalea agarivorans]